MYLADATGANARLLPRPSTKNADCGEGSLAWSPDSKQLAFFSDCADGKQTDIFLLDATQPGAAPRQLTHLHGSVEGLQWSPDGKHLGFLYVLNATRPAGALAAMKPPSGVIGVEGLEIQQVAAADPATGQVSTLTPSGLHVYEFDWSPDSQKLAYVAAPPPGENNWWVAKLYTQGVFLNGANNGSSPSQLGGRAAFDPGALLDPHTVSGPLHGLQIAVPRWSPDGKQIAFIGGLMSDQGATGGDIYTISTEGNASPVDITPDSHISYTWLQWLPDVAHRHDADVLGASAIVDGHSAFMNVGVHQSSGTDTAASSSQIFQLPASIGDGRMEMSLSLTRDGQRAAFISSSYDKAPEVYTAALTSGAQPQQITHVNENLKPAWGKAESVTWENGGFHVQGWLLQPANYDPAKKYPMIVMVHGGPSSAVLPRWPGVGYGGVPFSSLGYFVLFPNPRGSYGEGEKFTQANVKDFGYGDLKDILAGVDAVEKKYPVDDARLGLTGWSYGGFMTMFGVTQTNRFHAAVAGAGISDWQSYYGENSIDQWMIPFFGASVYDDPAVYAKSSAIDFIKQVKTPTLVVVGDRDGECPAPQSFEFWHALKAEGVRTELVVYPDEGHAFRSPEHRRDVLERALGWFDKYLPAQ